MGAVRRALGKTYDVATHFTPRYYPWDQRICVVPNGDLFAAIRKGSADVKTDEIETFTEQGIKLKSGEELPADIVVTATGFVMQWLGGVELSVDGKIVDLSKALTYKGVMLSNVPNLAAVFGYINASWTLKADLISNYICRLLNRMERKGAAQVTPRIRGAGKGVSPFVDHFTPSYLHRTMNDLPKQGAKNPWRAQQNYFLDIVTLKLASIEDSTLVFKS